LTANKLGLALAPQLITLYREWNYLYCVSFHWASDVFVTFAPFFCTIGVFCSRMCS